MQVAIIDYCLGIITVFDLPKHIDPNDGNAIEEYVENLPGYDVAWCSYMTHPEAIQVRVGKQTDFPEFNG